MKKILVIFFVANSLLFSLVTLDDDDEEEIEEVTEVVEEASSKEEVQKPAVISPAVISKETKENSEPWYKTIQFSGMIRWRPEVRKNVLFQSGTTENWVAQKAWLTFSKTFKDKSKAVIRLQDVRVWGGQRSSKAATDTGAEQQAVDVREAYVDLKNLLGSPFDLQVGRQRLFYGEQRLLGHLDWANVGRSFDAVRLKYNIPQTNSLHIFGAIVQEGKSLDLNNASANTTESNFGGIYNTFKGLGALHIDTYAFTRINADNTDLESIHTVGTRITNKTLGKKTARSVNYDYALEAALQFGKFNNQNIEAYAAALLAGYTLDLGIKIRFGIEVSAASGDKDPNDNKYQTFNQLYAVPHFIYGIQDLISWQNMASAGPNLKLIFKERMSLTLSYLYFQRIETSDAWYKLPGGTSTNLSAAALGDSKELYHEADVMFIWQAREFLNLHIGYAIAYAGTGIFDSKNVDVRLSHWSYLMTTIQF